MLQDEIDNAQSRVKTDAYQMSIGEIVSMYRDDELVINPDFQRLFRWEPEQKSKFVESILLGIPIPPIFVFEQEDSTWELIDGLQRISTILEFMGQLKEPGTRRPKPPSYLVGTKYLPSLDKIVWETSDTIEDLPVQQQVELEGSQRLAIRRARLSVEILKRPSDSHTKYELFQRLNAGGTPANPQELRNCIIIMVSDPFFQFLRGLAANENFRSVLDASEEQIERQRHMEYVCRFLVHVFMPYEGRLDVEEFITEGIIALATNRPVQREAENRFLQTFGLLDEAFGENALRRWDAVRERHYGRVGLAGYECIAVGIGLNLVAILALADPLEFVRQRVRQFWAEAPLPQFFRPGLRGTARIQQTIPFGERFFRP